MTVADRVAVPVSMVRTTVPATPLRTVIRYEVTGVLPASAGAPHARAAELSVAAVTDGVPGAVGGAGGATTTVRAGEVEPVWTLEPR